ncbi:EamA-like transporter family protein [Roseateles toxinivorans]|uniref:EamA-like transporter family protein n=2 Tax=Roseateles toxinivorans TaxID=270368 RepID=A0A4R6QUA7_9BURK|nr:EamA-like transporter family protein [Roseateles toxinivorans]
MSEAMKGQLLCSLAMVLVGSTVVVSRIIGVEVEPFLATAMRHALALPVFLLLMHFKGARLPRVGTRDAALLLVQAAAGSVGYTVLLIQGVVLAGAANAGIVTGTLPAVAALFAVLFLGERPGVRLGLAIALAALGVVVVTLPSGAPALDAQRLKGVALVLGAVACEAVFILANKRLSRPMPALALSTLMCAGGLLLSVVPAWLAAGPAPLTVATPALLGIVYYAWVPTVLGFLLWYAGSARTSGARASLATAWLPVSAMLLSALCLAEPISAWQWLGLGCVLLAMVLAAPRGRTAA